MEDSKNIQQDSAQLDQCIQELEQSKDQLKRLNADFDNYQRRVARERFEWEQRARVAIVKDLLPIIDDITRGMQVLVGSQDANAQAFIMVSKAVDKFLEKNAIKEVDCQGELNPEFHEAIMQVTSADHASGAIVSVLQKGYTLDGSIIRPAQVSVAS
jgi:molecular chaperone GrpE